MKTVHKAKTVTRDLLRTAPAVAWALLRVVMFKRRPHHSVDSSVKGRVLVVATNAIGDTVTLLPALQRVIKSQRSMKVDVLVRPKTAPLFKFVPNIEDVITLEKLTFPFKGRAFVSNIRKIRQLRSRNYQSAIIFSSNFWTAWVAFLIGARKRYGFSRTEKVGLVTIRDFGFLLTHDKKEIASRNYVEAHLEFSDWLLGDSAESQLLPQLSTGFVDRLPAVRRDPTPTARPLVVLNPFASQAIKEWPLERWGKLADALVDRSIEVMVCCEAEQAERLQGVFDETRVRIVADHSLGELITDISNADAIVTNDSGPLHLAYALGKPAVAIFGPTDPDCIIPHRADVTVVEKQIECAPCYHLGIYDRCPLTHHRCLRDIEPRQVLEAVLARVGDYTAPAVDDSNNHSNLEVMAFQ